MAVIRFSGSHVQGPGRPGFFRTAGGTLIPRGVPGIKLEAAMSRKHETANLDAVKMQHADVAQTFVATRDNSLRIKNNTPHIERLNEGWSEQTSPGFFERALRIAQQSIKGTWRLKETI